MSRDTGTPQDPALRRVDRSKAGHSNVHEPVAGKTYGGPVATSRTGTATWKRVREQALRRAQRAGQTKCPHCNVDLNYTEGRQPNSAEPDHLVPWSAGGKDHIDNLEVICRQCNQSKGHRAAPKTKKPVQPLKTSRKW